MAHKPKVLSNADGGTGASSFSQYQLILMGATAFVGINPSSTIGAIFRSAGNAANPVYDTNLLCDANGYITMAAQPRFQAKLTTNPTSVTGDGTNYTIICDTAIVNVGSSYNVSTGIFTIPTAGFYKFWAAALITGVNATGWTSGLFQIIRKNSGGVTQRQSFFRTNPGKLFDANSQVSMLTEFCDLCSAGDTISLLVSISGSTKSLGVFGDSGSNNYTEFGGILISK